MGHLFLCIGNSSRSQMVEVKRIHWEIDDLTKIQGSEEEIAKVFRFVIKLNSIYHRYISDKNGS